MEKTEIAGKLPAILEKALACTYHIYWLSQVAHWNVEGKDFYQLHKLFQDSYEDAQGAIDVIAEQIRILDVKVTEDICELIKQSTIKVQENHVKLLEEAHETLESLWNDISEISDQASNAAVNDLAGERSRTHGKLKWMFRATGK